MRFPNLRRPEFRRPAWLGCHVRADLLLEATLGLGFLLLAIGSAALLVASLMVQVPCHQ